MPGADRKGPELYAVIMAGGKGRRFWPRSRESKPKQLLPIGADKPLLRETVDRLLPAVPPERVFIACGQDIAAAAMKLTPEISKKNFIIEPVGRDTAPCVGLAMEVIRARAKRPDREVLAAVLPADHTIQKPERFRAALARAGRAALRRGLIVTIGIAPEGPSEAYGYIRPGAPVPGEKSVFMVERFVEKPDARTAARYVSRGFLWNAGMFVFRLDVMRDAFLNHLPEMSKDLARIGAALGEAGSERVVDKVFPRLQKISLDYGVMEKAFNVAVVKGDFGWRDVGGWNALYRMEGGDGKKNVLKGAAVAVESKGCYAEGGKLVALVGVQDLVVIETGDAVLVAGRERENDIKKLIALLEKKGAKEVL